MWFLEEKNRCDITLASILDPSATEPKHIISRDCLINVSMCDLDLHFIGEFADGDEKEEGEISSY
eukprot:CAMPEP_0176465554 /NCGR_PEP_ID=MMETSP0127-20121128/37347_1 /TAXON_ID=938130 /ORGANISM="Platyophrya macrostoma, Strain WH" /LENGTH=64 /DNA_ID=CAMNT_0017858515 /DNA_START=81 /DNA_END=275 /DNA_ORIENTATION=-